MSSPAAPGPGLSIIALGRTTAAHIGHLVALFPRITASMRFRQIKRYAHFLENLPYTTS